MTLSDYEDLNLIKDTGKELQGPAYLANLQDVRDASSKQA